MHGKRFLLILVSGFCACLPAGRAQTMSGVLTPQYAPAGFGFAHLVDRMDVLRNDSLALFTEHKPFRAIDIEMAVQRAWSIDEPAYFLFYREFGTELDHRKPVAGIFYRHPAHLFSVEQPDFRLFIDPGFDLFYGRETGVNEHKYGNTRAALMRGIIANKLGFAAGITENQGNFPEYVMERTASQYQAFPGEGRTKPFKTHSLDFTNAWGYITFNVMPQVSVQFGQDKLFIGNGYRSMFLSGFSNNYPFLRLNTRVWRVEYQNLFTQMLDYRPENIADGPIMKKFAAFHHLEIQLARHLNLGLFEGVVFASQDSTGRPGFELAYLNPLIFYRSVEYQLGSADNVVMGLDWKWNFLRHFSFYGQLVLDDMRYWDILRNTGWWGNKYGMQAGLKYFDAFGVPYLDLQAEFNTARPYTFSHDDQRISYSHFAQPLAHPLGANFREGLLSARYQPVPRWLLTGFLSLASFGADSSGTNYGSNILLDNSQHGADYGHFTGQGIPTSLLLARLRVSWMFAPNLYLDLQYIHRRQNSAWNALDRKTDYVSLGFRMNLPARDFDF